jgi:ATP-dependent Clp protease adaptor protein ClpS
MKQTKNKQNKTYKLTVYNNDNISFNDIIFIFKSLGHATLQAEQCALLIHTTGKTVVKSGPYKEMESMCTALHDRSITAEIEKKLQRCRQIINKGLDHHLSKDEAT